MISLILLLLGLFVSYKVYYGGTSAPEEPNRLEIQVFTPEKLVKFNGPPTCVPIHTIRIE